MAKHRLSAISSHRNTGDMRSHDPAAGDADRHRPLVVQGVDHIQRIDEPEFRVVTGERQVLHVVTEGAFQRLPGSGRQDQCVAMQPRQIDRPALAATDTFAHGDERWHPVGEAPLAGEAFQPTRSAERGQHPRGKLSPRRFKYVQSLS